MATKTEQLQLTEQRTAKLHWSFWLGVAFFVSVIIAIITLSWYVTSKMSAQESMPVTSIVISGEMPYTDKADIERAIERIDLGNFFNVDVNQVQAKVSSLPWVYSVSVRKHWPNELKIYVVDQQPIAYWNGDFLLNHQGVAFQADISRIHHNLPAFFGPEGSESVALENYINISRLLEYGELAIDELLLSERYSWQLTLNDGVVLNLGRENRVQRLQRFMDVYPEIKANKKADQQVNYVDLRYETGLAVGWKPQIEKERV
ncbi:cell division protein FtsQ [Thalassotalea insulae]|uniref:Cell division protein FtsQ n=1 Tax=Thalassotalea insulae TaxID=2056778 RepID=A0ABQ6GR24_9GAMM|nr:cell division protein FtsQ/DivIB [Thalassotalea insulae]GLX77794.1 cell division protein FtsQ [Thalassotalea insulae]